MSILNDTQKYTKQKKKIKNSQTKFICYDSGHNIPEIRVKNWVTNAILLLLDVPLQFTRNKFVRIEARIGQ